MNNNYLKYFVYALAAAVLFYLLIQLSDVAEFVKNMQIETQEEKIIFIIGFLIVIHLVLLIHELGHVVMGLLQGFRFELLVVGLLGIKRDDDKIKIYLNKDLGYYGGLALTLPQDDSPENLRKFANVILAGPIASLIFAVMSIFTVNYFINPYGIIAFFGGVTSFGIFLATTIPSKSGMFFTDRKKYQRLTTPGKDQEVELAMLTIIGSLIKNKSYVNINKEIFNVIIEDDDPNIKHYGLFNLMLWHIEHDGVIDENVKDSYNNVSKLIHKNVVKAYDEEIRKYADSIQKMHKEA